MMITKLAIVGHFTDDVICGHTKHRLSLTVSLSVCERHLGGDAQLKKQTALLMEEEELLSFFSSLSQDASQASPNTYHPY